MGIATANVEPGFTPVINTGVACARPGVGQIGAGITAVPMECFVKALEAFAATRSAAADSRSDPSFRKSRAVPCNRYGP